MKTDTATDSIDEYELPCTEALIAGTLALMTGHAQACCDGHRSRLAGKIHENLALLSQHPALSAPLRSALWKMRGHWQALQQGPSGRQPGPLWHGSPAALQ